MGSNLKLPVACLRELQICKPSATTKRVMHSPLPYLTHPHPPTTFLVAKVSLRIQPMVLLVWMCPVKPKGMGEVSCAVSAHLLTDHFKHYLVASYYMNMYIGLLEILS